MAGLREVGAACRADGVGCCLPEFIELGAASWFSMTVGAAWWVFKEVGAGFRG